MLLRFYATLRTVMGVDSQEVHDRNVDSFRKLLNFLLDRYPHAAFHLVDGSGNLRPDVPVFVDGRPMLLSINAPLGGKPPVIGTIVRLYDLR